MNSPLIENTIEFVKEALFNAESGHDWWHTHRVWKTACYIAESEPCNKLVVWLGALLHDISDAKLNGGNEDIAIKMAAEFLKDQKVPQEIIHQVLFIIGHVSYRKSFHTNIKTTPELDIVMDADRLDAMGAIGIARAFNYGGFKNRPIHNPEIPLTEMHNYASYTTSTAPTINHFYEKLLKLKDLMNTATGKKLAEERHDFMQQFLNQFFKEWDELNNCT